MKKSFIGDKKERSLRSYARKEMLKEKIESKSVVFLLFVTIISVSALFVFLVSQVSLTGHATFVDSKAGDVSEITLYRKFATSYWSGLYGLALRVPDFTEQLSGDFGTGSIFRQDVFFDCIQSDVEGGNEVYVSTSPVIDFDNLQPLTPQEVDEFTGCSGSVDCAVETFTDKMEIKVGTRTISNIPATHTYQWEGNNSIFDMGILTDGTNYVYVTHISKVQRSYDYEKIVNFQILIPSRPSLTQTLYFFTDPYDECPAGAGIGENLNAQVYGFAFSENGQALSNATITVAGISTSTSEDGSYLLNFTALVGEYNFFANKEGFDDYFSTVEINFSNYSIEKNFTMSYSTPGVEELYNLTVSGKVTDSYGTTLPGVKILLGGNTVMSDSSGNYKISSLLSSGGHSIVALFSGYNNFHQSINVSNNFQTETVDIVMEEASQVFDFETGPYTQEPGVQQQIEEVRARGEDHWINTKEIDKEVRQNTFVQEVIQVYNLRNTNMNLQFELSANLRDFVKIDKNSLSVSPDSSDTVKVTIYGTKPLGVYEGTLTISGDLEQEIPIRVTIVEKKFSVEVLLMEVSLFKSIVQPGDYLKYKVNLQNLLRDQSYGVDLEVFVKDLSGETVYASDAYHVEMRNSLSALKEIKIPENVSSGDYLIEIRSNYLETFSVITSSFVVSKPLYLYSFFGVPVWVFFSIVSFFSFFLLNVFMYKRYQDRKKRYRIQLEYSTLPEPGSRTVRIGNIAETHHPAYYEIDKLTTHAIVAGATGMGKSISAQVVIEECLKKDIAVIVFDPTAQWSGMLRKCDDKRMISLYSKFGLKPQDATAFKGNVRMIRDSKQKLDINKYVSPGQIQIFSMNKLTPSEIDVFVSNVIKQVFRSDPKESPNLKTLLVFDEVHRLLPKFGGSGKGFLQIERACREFRKWGLGVMLISQVLNDFAGQIKANINTELQARTLEEGDLERIRTKYGEEFLKSLVRAEVGVIMFQNADYNRGRPYFVNFRPILHSTRRLSDEELEKYNKYNEVVDDLEFQIEELEKEKVDTFDLKMELKLVKDKIMSGSFSVVEIYLEGLLPRAQKEWEKIGKKAPKKKLELVSDKEMEEEERRAKEEKEKEEVKEKIKKAEEKVLDEGAEEK